MSFMEKIESEMTEKKGNEAFEKMQKIWDDIRNSFHKEKFITEEFFYFFILSKCVQGLSKEVDLTRSEIYEFFNEVCEENLKMMLRHEMEEVLRGKI